MDPAEPSTPGVDRRSFMAAAAAAGGALPQVAAAESAPEGAAAPGAGPQVGADVMVDVMRSLGLAYVAANPGSSFRGLHESIVNYAGNARPEFLTCMHEESSVAMAHGYFKAAGKPMAVLAHSTVGLQHAAMALYNTWCDRAPVIAILGNILDATQRRPGVEWTHTAQDPVAMVRDFVKWDDQPGSLQHFAESLVRAHKIALTPPMAPVILVADGELQECHLGGAAPKIPRLAPTVPPQGDAAALREAARLLLAAAAPVIVVDRVVRSADGMARLVELAETLGAPVIDQGGRMNFPTPHPLSQNDRGGALIRGADVILAMELTDVWGTINEYIDNAERTTSSRIKPGTKVISLGTGDLYVKSNYQDFQRYAPVDLAIGGDAETTLPALIETVRTLRTAGQAATVAARTATLAEAKAKARAATREAAAVAWDASPIATARLAAELWAQIKGEDWVLVSADGALSSWPRRLWPFDRHYRHIGGAGGQGVGYGLPAAVGAALACRDAGRFAVNIQTDGDLMYAPGALWTAVHHRIPLLSVMHNNRAYHQETMHIQRMANRHNRGVDRAHIGTVIADPFVDYAALARSMGMWAEGPIADPAVLGPALKRAVAVVKQGRPALLDVVTQPR
jgi:thiamine pyrophosphate-dependent acetolactate synthase large subunit-like protein